jgi:hypothetical protein
MSNEQSFVWPAPPHYQYAALQDANLPRGFVLVGSDGQQIPGRLIDGTPLEPAEVRKCWESSYGDKSGHLTLYEAAGCDNFGNRGYRGWLGIHELLVNSRAVKALSRPMPGSKTSRRPRRPMACSGSGRMASKRRFKATPTSPRSGQWRCDSITGAGTTPWCSGLASFNLKSAVEMHKN